MRTFEVRSPNLNRGEELPRRYTREDSGGDNLSIPLHIDALPGGTQSVAFALLDRDAAEYVHWLVVDVPPGDIRLGEGASRQGMPGGARQLYNSAGYEGYAGPNPRPRAGEHRYQLLAYALDVPSLEIDAHAGAETFRSTAEAHALAAGQNYWVYGDR